ncbi:MerR family transcriptional regulator [Sphaerisporangium fuscum]|uniref:MerR family transcriptional regulator n=1 Tax=Sphaerisporangium fuscum TaxID=2835868 RepID=UPI001BDD6996|nr:MerR family transcriptional regulator [Sphaerisporangium fuscum]
MTEESAAGGEGTPLGEDETGYGIGAVARRLGVPAPTLRTWNLRYGIGPSRRSPGGHRRYDDADLRRLEEMNRLVHTGMPPADAARQALRGGLPAVRPAPVAGPRLPDTEAAARPPSAAMLARAVFSLDGPTVGRGLRAALGAHGVAWTWERLARPVFETIVRRQERTGGGVEFEHLFSDRLQVALAEHAGRAPAPVYPRPVLLACAEDEQHSLPAHALAGVLGELAVETRVLGARTPYPALADAVRRTAPAVVFVWSQQRETGDAAPLAGLPRLRPPSHLVVGGPGWTGELPQGSRRVTTLQEAVSTVMALVG